MKFFVFIFSFYTLALSCIPCGDSGECNINAGQKISIATQHPDHQQEASACSSFCSCACCSAVSFYPFYTLIKTMPLVFQQINFHYGNDDFQSCDLYPIWQPPRIT